MSDVNIQGTKDDGRKTQDERPKGREKAQKRQKEGNRGGRGFARIKTGTKALRHKGKLPPIGDTAKKGVHADY